MWMIKIRAALVMLCQKPGEREPGKQKHQNKAFFCKDFQVQQKCGFAMQECCVYASGDMYLYHCVAEATLWELLGALDE